MQLLTLTPTPCAGPLGDHAFFGKKPAKFDTHVDFKMQSTFLGGTEGASLIAQGTRTKEGGGGGGEPQFALWRYNQNQQFGDSSKIPGDRQNASPYGQPGSYVLPFFVRIRGLRGPRADQLMTPSIVSQDSTMSL